jgi:putative phosphoesterase
MKLLVFSDTHGHFEPMLQAARAEKDVDAIFFLGDGMGDAEVLEAEMPGVPVYSVVGNCDYAATGSGEGLVPIGGLLIYYTHGHSYAVKGGVGALLRQAKRREADIALYGHTHTPHYEEARRVYLFNPGSAALPRGGPATYGVITVKGGKPSFDVRQV